MQDFFKKLAKSLGIFIKYNDQVKNMKVKNIELVHESFKPIVEPL